MEENGNINYGYEPSGSELDLTDKNEEKIVEKNAKENNEAGKNSVNGKRTVEKKMPEKNADGINQDEIIVIRDNKMTDAEIKAEKRSIWKNLAVIFVCNVLIQSPFLSFTNIMSSLLQERGEGFAALMAAGIAQPLAAAFLVTYSTKVLGIRKMVSLSMLLALTFNIAFFYPIYWVIVPAGSLVGFVQAIFCSSAFLYGGSLGFWYGKLSDGKLDTVLAVMAGLINGSLGSGFFVGNILLYFILHTESAAAGNSTTNDMIDICGNNYCNEDISHMTTMKTPDPWKYNLMVGLFAGMTATGILLSFFLRNFASNLGQTPRKASEFFTVTKEMWMLLRDPRGYLLIVILLFAGLEEGFVLSDFTQAYISCSIGIPNVGLLMAGYGIAQIVISLLQWILAKYLGRILTVIIGTSLLMGCFITLSFWTPQSDETILLGIVTVLWSSGDAIIVSTVFSVCNLLFEDNVEGSFAVGQVWFALGFLLSFGWSHYFCILCKLYILMGVGFVGLALYIWLEVLLKRNMEIKK